MLKHVGHVWQSVSLIASNAAALLPAYWSLRHKAFAELVLFTSSGISSGLYHACDVGTWCALTFHVLQFMDFWLSFMAVVTTFVYLATISEISKRTIHTIVAILTTLLAETGPTRSSNIIIVVAIGDVVLLIGFLIELSTRRRMLSLSSSTQVCLNLIYSWEGIKTWIQNLIKTILKRFYCVFLLFGFIALAMAAISWKWKPVKAIGFGTACGMSPYTQLLSFSSVPKQMFQLRIARTNPMEEPGGPNFGPGPTSLFGATSGNRHSD
ncbi:hypothetical protein DM860_001205 [Cuscuta australis]|uniref:Transmembrane protein n=1 Tax=Cuscuta australis TaxID=267555 RepID=A0A328DT67_9ASTE|nr:hypothetical protein DM860_001205 [Cuscuta australis]